jgi:hypothetical protein
VTSTASKPAEARDRLVTGVRYSICTLVTRPEQYDDMLRSFQDRGFDAPDCEYVQIDNTRGNQFDGYGGCNLFLTVARGEFVIICHQDVLLIDDRAALDRTLGELERLDPAWAVCGNSGGMAPGRRAIRITDPHGADQRTTRFPARVHSLDENFLVIRRSANLSASSDLTGFHLYGTDICILADVVGRSAYVIDFHVRHLSPGRRDDTLSAAREAMVAKYRRAFSSRWVMTPCELMFMSGSGWLSRMMNFGPMPRLLLMASSRRPRSRPRSVAGPPA